MKKNNFHDGISIAPMFLSFLIVMIPILTMAQKGEESFFDLEDSMVVSASKIKQNINEAPSVISVFSQDMIQTYGWISINDIMYKMPGFFPYQDYERRTVGSRGMIEGWNNNHYMLLMDGVQFNENAYGTAQTWEITPVNFIKSVEIIRGPGSALYGSYAMNGVIQINTYTGEDLKGSLQFGT